MDTVQAYGSVGGAPGGLRPWLKARRSGTELFRDLTDDARGMGRVVSKAAFQCLPHRAVVVELELLGLSLRTKCVSAFAGYRFTVERCVRVARRQTHLGGRRKRSDTA